MTIKTFAKKFDEDEDGMIEILKDNGFLKANGDPKAKYVDEFFDEDGNIIDPKGLQEELEELLEDDDDDEDEDDTKDENDEKEDDDLDIDNLKKSIDEFEFESAEDIGDLIKLLTDKLVDFEDDNDEDEDEDEEDDDDEEEDHNGPGKYRGWTITVKGIKVTATKGKKIITTSLRGNIRKMIDEKED